ncbi:exonuclease VII [Kaustia mangrovi]|uniref:Exonuclease VII n=1 Tax=Kaustia mangrovi TaxID=2593653 RepID=A0A7S8HDR6_9HYPH|nr:exonuclease VII [Kaustia mangrovi]
MAARRRIKHAEIPQVKRALIQRQDGRCALCPEAITLATACLDHDHKSGLIRGALCRNCNGIEGKVHNLANRAKRTGTVKDWLGALILYYVKHETDQTGLYHPLHKTDEEKRLRRNKKARERRQAAKLEKTGA